MGRVVASIVLDANIVISALDPSHIHHCQTLTFLDDHAGDDFYINDFTLAEVLAGASSREQELELLDAIRRDLAAEPIGFTGTDWAMELAGTRKNSKPRLRMPDAIVLATAKRLNGIPLTHDSKLREAAKEAT
jgi:predicted nucleic acid-binding protein